MRKSRSRRPRHGFWRSQAVRKAAKERLSRSKLVRRSLARSKLFTYREYICGRWARLARSALEDLLDPVQVFRYDVVDMY